MSEKLGRLLAALRRLMPNQKSSGDAAVQVGHAGGDVNVVNVTHNQHVTLPSTPPPSLARPDATVPEVLRLLDQLDSFGRRGVVLAWMRSSFRSTQVKSLDQGRLNRTRAYAAKVLENSMEEARVVQLAVVLQNRHTDGARGS